MILSPGIGGNVLGGGFEAGDMAFSVVEDLGSFTRRDVVGVVDEAVTINSQASAGLNRSQFACVCCWKIAAIDLPAANHQAMGVVLNDVEVAGVVCDDRVVDRQRTTSYIQATAMPTTTAPCSVSVAAGRSSPTICLLVTGPVDPVGPAKLTWPICIFQVHLRAERCHLFA